MHPTSLLAIGALALTPAAAHAQAPAETDPKLEFIFEETVTMGATVPVGPTALGRRTIMPITGGHFEGPNIRGTVMPGGWDWQLGRADGCVQIHADYMLRTDDGVIINLLNKGLWCPPVNGVDQPMRAVAVFEPPIGRYSWLGQSMIVGKIDPVGGEGGSAVRIRFYRVR